MQKLDFYQGPDSVCRKVLLSSSVYFIEWCTVKLLQTILSLFTCVITLVCVHPNAASKHIMQLQSILATIYMHIILPINQVFGRLEELLPPLLQVAKIVLQAKVRRL